MGFGPGFDGVFGGGDSWIARRKAAEAQSKSTSVSREQAGETNSKAANIKEEDEEPDIATTIVLEDKDRPNTLSAPEQFSTPSVANETFRQPENRRVNMHIDDLLGNAGQYESETSFAAGTAAALGASVAPSSTQSYPDLGNIEWSYLDPQGNVQGKGVPCLDIFHK
jgi:PERQ amino acid-rich with GYF domain-containing protein